MTVRDGRKAPFIWAAIDTLSYLRDEWRPDAGVSIGHGLSTYFALTELANEDHARANTQASASGEFTTKRAEIAARAGISDKPVDKAIRELERIGLLEVERSGARASIYILREADAARSGATPHLADQPAAESLRTRSGATPPQVRTDSAPGPELLRTPYIRRSKKKKKKQQQGVDSVDPVVGLYEFWKTSTGRNGGTHLTPGRRAKVAARIEEGYSVEDIRRAIANCAASPFHQGRNDRNRRFDDLTLICRNGEKLEEFRDMGDGEGGSAATRPGPTGPVTDGDTARRIWDVAKETLRAGMPESTFNLWIACFEAAGQRDGRLVLVDSTELGGGNRAQWAGKRYAALVLQAIADAGGEYSDVEFVDEAQLEMEAR